MQSLVEKAMNHLKKNRMTYFSHMKFTLSRGLICLKAGTMLCVHSFLPCFFEKVGSKLVKYLKLSFDRQEKEKKI